MKALAHSTHCRLPVRRIALSLLACLCGFSFSTLAGADPQTNASIIGRAIPSAAEAEPNDLRLKVFEPKLLAKYSSMPVTWLGVAAEEASEALTSQLQMAAGVGLIVTYVAPDSPAAKAGLRKNDLLVDFEGQALVHPAQLKKLVQVRNEGDVVNLAFLRAGKQETLSVTLSKTTERIGWPLEGFQYDGWKMLPKTGQGFPYSTNADQNLSRTLRELQHSLGELHLDGEQVHREVLLSMNQARKAANEALRYYTNDHKKHSPTAKMLQDLARGWARINKDATVTVHSTGTSVQTTVKADDSGTYVIVANPQKHLTVHDRAGKLLFDGAIDTAEEQAAVPRDIWEKVQPMVDKIGIP